MTDNSAIFQPIIFGEVLFDVFAPDQVVLGGAPFNVAWHLHGFGLKPVFISRIGQDEYGERILSAMQEWGMSTAGVQIDPHHQTGTVQVSLNNGQPQFHILEDVAYDHIDADAAKKLIQADPCTIFYHGSLVARTKTSHEQLKSLRNQAGIIFADINLRKPWWERTQIFELIQEVDVLKLNDDELATLMDSGIERPALEEAAREMLAAHQLSKVIVTCGEQGAFSVTEHEHVQSDPVRVNDLVDTVGAGDSFSAVCMLGQMRGWSEQLTLDRATGFAAQICRQRGATSLNTGLYQSCQKEWTG